MSGTSEFTGIKMRLYVKFMDKLLLQCILFGKFFVMCTGKLKLDL